MKFHRTKLKYFCGIKDGTHDTPKYVENSKKAIPFVTSKDIIDGKIDFSETKFISESDHNRFYKRSDVKKGDVLMPMIGTIGNPSLVKTNKVFSIKNVALFKTSKNLIKAKYLYFLLGSNFMKEQLELMKSGGVQSFVSLTILKNLNIIIPDNLYIMVKFLEDRTMEIDSLIKDKERLIKLLEEKRQAIITETVTKGLDTNVKMKDSGLEWMGEIPEHWDLIKLKYMTSNPSSLFMDGDWIESDVIEETGIRYLTTGNIGIGKFKQQGNGYISDETFGELNCLKVFPGDIAISRLNEPIARSCIVPQDEDYYVVAVDIVVFRPDNNFDKKFLVYLMNVKKFSEFAVLKASGATMLRISRTNLENFKFPIPNLEEQQKISTFLDEKTLEIDSLISNIKIQIQKIKEYRESLIYEAVTGKIDLRDNEKNQ